MGTNYYARDNSNKCLHCGRGEVEVHIGKSAAGWAFMLHVNAKGITVADILEYISDKKIVNEYEDEISFEDMKKIIFERSHPEGLRHGDPATDSHCVYIGDTHDCYIGEFS